MVEQLKRLLESQLALMHAAARVLEESRHRVDAFRDRLGGELSVAERESCEALTSRFARLIESADTVLADALSAAPELIAAVECVARYVADKGHANS